MNKTEKTIFILALLIGIVNPAASVVCILQLPEQIPTHYDINWICDGYGSRWIALPISLLALLAALSIPLTIRLQKNELNRKPAAIFMLIMTCYCTAINWITLYMFGHSHVQLGEKFENPMIGWALPLLFSGLMIAMGNYLPTLRPNSGIGIRVKWTMENEQVWKQTHRFAGKLWVVTGLLMTAACIVGICGMVEMRIWVFILFFEVLTVSVVVPCIYAWKHAAE
ncbi:MAG: SdpI family protein [Oscillospiraceae bacterium]|nr:SdpI family protein [Oscillospiraceae bacterium]